MKFVHFNDIDVNDKASYQNKSILSFDIDWASDDVIRYTMDLLRSYNIKYTVFVTHNSPILKELLNEENVEVGIHPNFNSLFETDKNRDSVDGILEKLIRLTSSKLIRNHSLTNSSRWLDIYRKHGIKYSSNYCLYGLDNNQPFYLTNTLIEVPVYFFDDAYIRIKNEFPEQFPKKSELIKASKKGLKVFGFHPIHIALNTGRLSFYEETRSKHQNLNDILEIQNKKNGVKDFLLELLEDNNEQ